MTGPPRQPITTPGWNDKAAVALLVLVAGHLLATEPPSVAGPLTPARPARFVAGHDLAALVAALEDSPRDAVRHAQVYQRVLPGLADALSDPYVRLDRARAARRAGLDLFAAPPPLTAPRCPGAIMRCDQ